jgi:hypothetical protein
MLSLLCDYFVILKNEMFSPIPEEKSEVWHAVSDRI